MLRKDRSRKRTLVGIAFLVFAAAVLAGGLFAFLTNNHKYSQITWETESDSAKINVTAADAAFTSDVKMTTEKVDDQEIIKLAKRTAGQNSNDILAFNITFTDKDGNETQPNSRVKVSIRPEDYNLDAERYALVHIDDNKNAKYLGNIAASSIGELVFYADSFSIYAIIPTTQTDQQRYARYTYEFYVNDEMVASQIVRNGDILNAPAAPSLDRLIFMGWYTDNNRVFNGLNQAVDIPDDTTADKTIKLHAKFADKIYSVVFFNPQGNVLATKTGTNGEAINTDDIRHEVSAGHFVDAWTTDASILKRYTDCGNDCEIPDNEVIPNQITGDITINNDNIVLYPIIRAVKWVHYHQNDDDADEYTEASYTSSDYAFYGHSVSAPNNPTRAGYDFVGWATDEQGTNMYDFSTPLTTDIDLYAIWRPRTNTQYRIVFWKESLVDGHYVEGSYEYASHLDTTGTSGATITVTQNQINNILNQDDFTYYELDHAETGAVIHGDGSTVVNVYLKLKVYTVNIKVETDTGYGNSKYCFHYYWGTTATTSCQRNSYATTTNLVATYTDSNGATHDLTKGYSFQARMGEIISDRYPGAGEITLSHSSVNNVNPYAYLAENNNPNNTIRVSKPVTMTEDLLLSNKTNGTTLILYGATSTNQVTVNYWLQNADDDGYTRSEDYSFVANVNGSGTFSGRTLTGYGDPLSSTPSGYSSSNTNQGIYHFYYNRDTYDLHFYNYNAPGNNHTGIRHGSSLVLYDYIPERPAELSSAFTFQGWYTTPDYIDGTEFDLTTEVMPMSDLMLYAKWENTNYVNITFNPNGGNDIPSQRILYGETAHVVDDPTRYGYSFVGWRKTDGSFFSFDNIILEDTELVASWVPFDTIYVHYDPNGGAIYGQDDLSYVDTSTTAILPEPDEIPEGKYFVGWNVNGRIYYPGNIVMILLSDIPDGSDTMTITAEWGKSVDKTSYSYDPNTATGEVTSFEQEQNEAFTVKTPAELGFEKTGYTFTGWNSEPDGSGVTYRAGTQWAADNRAVMPNVLYAQWEINCFTVTTLHQYADGSEYDATETVNKCYGDTYETHASEKDDTYYGTVTSGQATGTITDSDVTVVYTYKKRDAIITVHHVDENGEELAPDEEIPGTFDDTYTVNPSADLTPHYDYTSDLPLTGVIHGNLEITITYTKKHFTFTVKHQLEDGTEFDETESFDKLYLDTYNATPSTKDNNYEVINSIGAVSGVIEGDTEVTLIYAKKKATITATHKDAQGNTLAADVTEDKEWGDDYTTTPAADLIESYNYTTNGDAASGIVNGNKTVNYVYTLKQYTVTIQHVVTDGTTTTETQTVNHGASCTAEPKAELLAAYNVSQEGDCTTPVTSDRTIIFTYNRKQLTLTVKHQLEDGSEYDATTTETKLYGDHYNTTASTKDNNYEVVRIDGDASGDITADTTVTYVYAKKKAQIVTHHRDAQGNTLATDVTESKDWGETYTTSPATSLVDAYNYSTTGDPVSGTVDGDKEITYVYTIKQYTVTIKHVVTDGETTTETQTVNHGASCTANPKAELLEAYTYQQEGNCVDPVTSDRTITFTYNRKQLTLTVKHQLEDGSEYDTTFTDTLAYGDHYDAPVSTKDNNYQVVRTIGTASGIISADTEVTYVYAKKHATITTTHKDAQGNTLANDVTEDKEWGDEYTTSPAASLADAYNYTSTGDAVSGTVDGDKTVNYIYTLKQYTVTIKHVVTDGTTTTETQTVNHGASCTAEPKSELLTLYNVSQDGDCTTPVTSDRTITFTYEKKIATIVVHHVDESGNELAPDVTFTKPYGEVYVTEESDQIPGNYEFASRTNNYTDTAMQPNIVVTYSYQKKDASLSASVAINDGDDTLGNESQSSEYSINFTANVTDFIGQATVTIKNTLPYAIDQAASDLGENAIYDPETNTITWTEVVNIATVSETVNLNKVISLTFVNVPHTDRVAVNGATATITLDTGKTRTVSADATLAVEFYGDAVVRYYVENTTNELADEKTLHGLVGDIFSVEASEIDGYELLNADIAGEYSYSDDAQTIVFYYREILPPAPDNPNTSDGVKVMPIAGFGAILVFGLSFIAKRRRS